MVDGCGVGRCGGPPPFNGGANPPAPRAGGAPPGLLGQPAVEVHGRRDGAVAERRHDGSQVAARLVEHERRGGVAERVERDARQSLRHEGSLEEMAQAFNTELSHENPEMLFVTGVIGVLDLRDGSLIYCNAGHDAPYRMAAASDALTRLEGEGGGPPFSVIEDFPYCSAQANLQPGDKLVLITDGITEAMNPAGELFGSARLINCLEKAMASSLSPAGLCEAVQDEVLKFEDETGPADDKTMLVLQWNNFHRS